MAKDNQFWKVKSKVGREKIFSTPQIMWEEACKYFEWCDENPLIEEKPMVVDKSVETAEVGHPRPYTMGMLCVFLGVNDAYFRQFKADKKRCTDDFATVIARIETVVREQKFAGAAVGMYNANLISRDLGLVDKVQSENTNVNLNSRELTMQQVKEISKHLDKKY